MKNCCVLPTAELPDVDFSGSYQIISDYSGSPIDASMDQSLLPGFYSVANAGGMPLVFKLSWLSCELIPEYHYCHPNRSDTARFSGLVFKYNRCLTYTRIHCIAGRYSMLRVGLALR